jgi:hypothetical protein
MAVRMYNINCASARHLEAFADIPRVLADKIVAYRKIRKCIFHIDELYRIGGISRKYFRRLASVFYVPNQVVPRIGAQLPYSNVLSTVTVEQKHQNRNSNLKKRKMKIKKSENQRKVENRDRKRELKREGISKQFKPLALSKKCNLNRTNLKRLNTQNLGKKVQKKEVKYLIDRKGKYQYLRRRKTTGIGQSSVQSSKSAPSIQEANINEGVAGLLAAVHKLEGDTIDVEEDHIGMKEDHVGMEGVLTCRKIPYMCANRPETTDTKQRNESSEAAPSTRRLNINERVARLLAAVHKVEYDNIDMEEDKIDMEEDNIPTCSKTPEYSSDSSQYSNDSSQHSRDSSQYSSHSSEHDSDSSQYSSHSSENRSDSSQYSRDSSQYSRDSSQYSSHSSEHSSDSSKYSSASAEYSSDSSESIQSAVVQRGNINERVARLLAALPTLEGDNMEIEEDNIGLTNRKRKYQSVKSQETTDTDQRSKYSSVMEREYNNDAMERVAGWTLAIPKFEDDTVEMEEDNIKIEKDNIEMEKDNIP